MKAVQIDTYGGPETVSVREIAVPTPGPGQILVRIDAASLNPFDTKLREGMMQASIHLDFPYTPGGDFAGTVAALGTEVADVAVGDAVYGQAYAISGGTGAFAEYALTTPAKIARAPKHLTVTEKAALPLVAVSAYQALTEHIGLKKGQRLFINGGTGGIGAIALQLAKHTGTYVTVTATGDGIESARLMGADEVIDYRSGPVYTSLRGYDAVFDTAGNDFDASLKILKPGGIAVSMVASAQEALATELQVQVVTQGTQVTSKKLAVVAQLADDGIIRPHVAAVYPLSEARDAFIARETSRVDGKVVISMPA